MTSTATWLVDTSALARLSVPEVGEVLRPLIDAGRVAVAAATVLEVGYMARSQADHEQSQQTVLQRLQFVYGTPRSERRAIEVQRSLMGTGHHRAVKCRIGGYSLVAADDDRASWIVRTTTRSADSSYSWTRSIHRQGPRRNRMPDHRPVSSGPNRGNSSSGVRL